MNRPYRRSTEQPFGLALWLVGVFIGALIGVLVTVIVLIGQGVIR